MNLRQLPFLQRKFELHRNRTFQSWDDHDCLEGNLPQGRRRSIASGRSGLQELLIGCSADLRVAGCSR